MIPTPFLIARAAPSQDPAILKTVAAIASPQITAPEMKSVFFYSNL